MKPSFYFFSTFAIKSLLHRKYSILLSLFSITISLFILIGVEHIRHQTKSNFVNTVSGVDLIVGARTSPSNLLMYSIFHMGNATNNISWKSYQTIKNSKHVKWSIPFSLGDSHKGHRVVGTDSLFFSKYQYGDKNHLVCKQGTFFQNNFEVVLGYEVAQKFRYSIGDSLFLSHGTEKISFQQHGEHPFTVVGILTPTGTPIDRSLYIDLPSLEALHKGQSKSITAILLKLSSKFSLFKIQRQINEYKKEPLSAILPGVTLVQIWEMIGFLEDTLRGISFAIFLTSLLGFSAMLLATMKDRESEIATLRSLGAKPWLIAGLMQLETWIVTFFATVLASVFLAGLFLWGQSLLTEYLGLRITANIFQGSTGIIYVAIFVCSFLISWIPTWKAYRMSLSNQLRKG